MGVDDGRDYGVIAPVPRIEDDGVSARLAVDVCALLGAPCAGVGDSRLGLFAVICDRVGLDAEVSPLLDGDVMGIGGCVHNEKNNVLIIFLIKNLCNNQMIIIFAMS